MPASAWLACAGRAAWVSACCFAAKMMADMRHNLRLGHFVSRFGRDDPGAGFIILEPLFQFALGFARTKNQDGFSITNTGNDLVIIALEAPGVLSLARIIRRNRLVFKSA